MSIEVLQKDTATLYRRTETRSLTNEPLESWISVGTFKCIAGAPTGGVSVVTPGQVFPDSRNIQTTSDLAFAEGMRVVIAGESSTWLIIDATPARTLFGCGKVLFRTLRCREELGL